MRWKQLKAVNHVLARARAGIAAIQDSINF